MSVMFEKWEYLLSFLKHVINKFCINIDGKVSNKHIHMNCMYEEFLSESHTDTQ